MKGNALIFCLTGLVLNPNAYGDVVIDVFSLQIEPLLVNPHWLWLLLFFQGGGSVVVDSLLIDTPIVRFCNCSMLCCGLFCVHSSFAFISMGKRELVVLLCLSSWCLMIVVWLFLMSTVCDCGIY